MKRLMNLASLPFRQKPVVGATPHDVVHRENKWRLLRYRPRPAGLAYRTPVLLVPSLINRHYVLDLAPRKSFAEFLVAAGFDVWCVDWGTPGPEDRYLDFEEVVDRYLGRAIRRCARTSPRNQAHVLGYCMGGTLAAIHAAVHNEHVASLTAVAAPIAFQQAGILGEWMRNPGFDVDAMVDATGNVPWELMQAAFLMIRPTLGLAKAVNLVDRAWNDKFLDGFLALETWANDNVAVPGEFYRTYVRCLYQRDELVRGELALGGRRVRLENLRMPVLTVTFSVDTIAPEAACLPLATQAGSPDRPHVRVEGSHVGGMTSSAAARGLWPQIAGFWAHRDAGQRTAV